MKKAKEDNSVSEFFITTISTFVFCSFIGFFLMLGEPDVTFKGMLGLALVAGIVVGLSGAIVSAIFD